MISKVKSNLHSHTRFCDGQNSAEEMVQEAISRGFQILGFSGHSPTAFDPSYCMSPEDIPLYRAEIATLKERYRDQIQIYCGLELDILSDDPTEPFDYLIGAMHYLFRDGVYLPIDENAEKLDSICRRFYEGNWYALAADYYAQYVHGLKKRPVSFVAHLDLVTKFNELEPQFDENDPAYLTAAFAAIDHILELKLPLEINTGAMARGYRSGPYPARPLMDYFLDRGGRILLNSDCHVRERLDFGFDRIDEFYGRPLAPYFIDLQEILPTSATN